MKKKLNFLSYKSVHKHINTDLFITFILAVIIILFYWPLSFIYVIPTQDGAQCLSFYSYIYSGFKTFGKIFLWNPYLIGGAEDNVISYMFSGVSATNPILLLWLYISKFSDLNILASFYYYHLIFIWIGAVASYHLGKNYLFGQCKTSALFLAVITSCSGYLVSVTPQLNFVISYSLIPVILYLGIKVLYKNRFLDYLSLAFWLTVLLSNSFSTISIGILIYVLPIFISITFFNLKFLNFGKKRLLFIFAFLLILTGLNIPNILSFINYKYEGYRRDPTTSFIGMIVDVKDSNEFMNFYWLLNTFIPNSNLSRWGGIGNGGLFNNTFLYLGFVSPILTIIGIYYFSKKTTSIRGLFSGIIFASILSIFYLQGHSILRLNPSWNTLTSYPTHSIPLLIYSIIIFSAFGFYAIYEKDIKVFHKISMKQVFLFALPTLIVAVILVLSIFKLFIDPLKIDKYFFMYTVSYCFVMFILYWAAVNKSYKFLFLVVFIADLLFFLSSSKALISHPYRLVSNYDVAKHIDRADFKLPHTLNYSISKGYPGSHFAIGPTLYRESGIQEILHSFFPRKRAYWAEWYLLNSTINSYDALDTLGVTKSKYYLTNHIVSVKNYVDIYSFLNSYYEKFNAYTHDNNMPKVYPQTPVVLAEKELPVLGGQTFMIDKNSKVNVLSKDDIKKLLELSITNSSYEKLVIPFNQFKEVNNNGIFSVFEYKGDLPLLNCLITEKNIQENLCGVVTDNLNLYYYPLSGDIFNFSDHSNGSDLKYMIQYNNFYAIYPVKDKPPKLYIRIDKTKLPANINLNYIKDTITNPKFNLPSHFNTEKLTVNNNSFIYNSYINNSELVYNTSELVSYLPSFSGSVIKRHALTQKGIDISEREDGKSERISYSINNEVLTIYKAFNIEPNIQDDIDVNINNFNRDIYAPSSGIDVVYEDPDKVNLKIKCVNDCFFVSRNIYSPNWKVKADNKILKTYPVMGLYMGVFLPQGEHDLTMEYDILYIKIFAKIMFIILLVIITFSIKMNLSNVYLTLKKYNYKNAIDYIRILRHNRSNK